MKPLIFFFLLQIPVILFSQVNKIQLGNTNYGIRILEKNDLGFRAGLSLNEISFTDISTEQGWFTQLHISGFTKNYAPGHPQIPVLSQLIEYPTGAVAQINILSYTTETIKLQDYGITYKIAPSQLSYSKSADPSEIIFHYDETLYQTDGFFRTDIAEVNFEGTMRGVGTGTIILNPVHYNPVKNVLLIHNNLEVEVIFEHNNINEYKSEKSRVYSPLFERLYNKLINYIPVSSSTKDTITKYPIKYVIVAPPTFKDSLQNFIRWKTQKGFKVIEAYTDNPLVGNTTTSIKNYLQSLYVSGTPSDPAPSYVLIVGDIQQIPSFNGTTGSHVTDMYYCEYDGGGTYIPDTYFGRFSAQNINQLIPQINKTLKYEQYTLPGKTFLDTVIMVAGVDDNFAQVHCNGQINYGVDHYFNSAFDIYSHTYLYPSTEQPAVEADIIVKLSEGFGFANYTAHCSESGWADPSFTTSHIPAMSNIHKYGLMIGNCCLSNKFDVDECFGEAILRAANKGATGYIGGSNKTYWDEDYYWGVGNTSNIVEFPTYAETGLGAYDGAFHSNGESYQDWYITNAEINFAGNLAVQQSTSTLKDYYWEIYHLMGDPSVMNFFSEPSPLFIEYENTLLLGEDSLDVATEIYTYVALSINGVLLDAKYSGSANNVTLQFPSLTEEGTALLVTTKQNKIPHIEIINIIANIAKQFSSDNISIFPSPTKSNVTIKAAHKIEYVQIYDIRGKIIDNFNVSDYVINVDVSNYRIGLYYVKIITEKSSNVGSLIVH